MTTRNPALWLVIAVATLGSGLGAQSSASPDRSAYSQAVMVADPDARRAALEKFLADFRTSAQVYAAHLALVEILVRAHPDQEAAIIEHAASAVAKTPNPTTGADVCLRIAGLLSKADMLPGEVEKYAKKSMVLTNSTATKVSALTLLGHVQFQQGRLQDAEASFREALAGNPRLTDAAVGLADVYAKRGNDAAALATLVDAAASGKMDPAARRRLEYIYATAPGGTTAGLDDAIDARYRTLFPPPFSVDRYQATKSRSDRTVLLELFTGSGCPPCVAADLALDRALARYAGTELAVLVYHQHIPLPDPLSNPQSVARFTFYRGSGVPTMAVDAKVTSGGGSRDAVRQVYSALTADIEKRLKIPAEAELTLRTSLDGTKVRATATVARIARPAADLKLQLVLAEADVHYTGENGIRFHPMVVRNIAGTAPTQGFAVVAGDAKPIDWVFDLDEIGSGLSKYLSAYEIGRGIAFAERKDRIGLDRLAVVAFIQDVRTRDVLQAAVSRVRP